MAKIVVCDLDGCLNYYPKCFLDWVSKNYIFIYDSIDQMKMSMSVELYEEIKQVYRVSGAKRQLPIRKGAIKTLQYFKSCDWEIHILTARPTFSPVKEDTLYWLRKFNFDVVKFYGNKYEYIREYKDRLLFVIDDDEQLAMRVVDLGIKVFLFGSINYSNIIPVKSWGEIMRSVR